MRLVLAIAALVFVWLLPAGILIAAVPPVKKQLDEFGMQLPWATMVAIEAGSFLANSLATAVAAVAFVVVAVVTMSLLVSKVRGVPRTARVLWWATAPIPPLLASVFLAFALIVPMMKLAEGLSK